MYAANVYTKIIATKLPATRTIPFAADRITPTTMSAAGQDITQKEDTDLIIDPGHQRRNFFEERRRHKPCHGSLRGHGAENMLCAFEKQA